MPRMKEVYVRYGINYSIVFHPLRCLVCFPRSILSSSASTIVTDGLLLQSGGCRAGCVLCAWWSVSIVPITVKKTT